MEIKETLLKTVDLSIGTALGVGAFVIHQLKGGAWGEEFADA